MDRYIRLVLAKGKQFDHDGRHFKRVSSMICIDGVPGLVFIGCLVEMIEKPISVLFYLSLTSLQVEHFRAIHPGFKICENESGNGAKVPISWEQYVTLLGMST